MSNVQFTDEQKQFMVVLMEKFDGAVEAHRIRDDQRHVVLSLGKLGMLSIAEERVKGSLIGVIVASGVGQEVYKRHRSQWVEDAMWDQELDS